MEVLDTSEAYFGANLRAGNEWQLAAKPQERLNVSSEVAEPPAPQKFRFKFHDDGHRDARSLVHIGPRTEKF